MPPGGPARDTGRVISLELARALRGAGLRWRPAPGDRFTIDQPELVGEVFTVAEMSIETHRFPTGTVLGFNGTVEWALDSIGQHEVVWLPREDQLREALAHRFAGLERLDGATGGYAVVLTDGGRYVDIDAERAYARALLAVLST